MSVRRVPAERPAPPTSTPPPSIRVPDRWDGAFDPELWPLLADGRTALQQGRLDEAERAAHTALRRVRPRTKATSPNPDGDVEVLAVEGTARTLLGLVLRERGRPEDATHAWEQAVEVFARGGDRIGRSVVSFAAGVALLGVGRAADALTALQRAFEEGEDTPDQRRYHALALRAVGRSADAYEHLRRSAPRAPHDWRAWELLVALGDEVGAPDADRRDARLRTAHALARAGRYGEALAHVEEARELDASATVLAELAVAQARVGRGGDALETLDELASRGPLDPAARVLRAEVLLAVGREDEAVTAALDVPGLDADEPELLERQATVLLQADRYDDLLARVPLLEDAGSGYAVRYRAWALLGAGRTDEAVDALRAAVRDEPDAADLRGILGWAEELHGDLDAALVQLQAAVELDADYVWAHVTLARVLDERGEPEEAVGALRPVADDHPDDEAVQLALGDLLRRTGAAVEAREHLAAAVRLDGFAVDAWLSLALTLRDLGERAEASAAWRRVLDLDPDNVMALVGVAEQLLESQDLADVDEAGALLDRAAERDDTSALVHAFRGEVDRRWNRLEEAEEHLDRALELDSAWAWALGTRGQVLSAAGRWDEALRDLRRADELEPDVPWVLEELAQVNLALDDAMGADDAYANLTRLQPGASAWWLARAALHRGRGRTQAAERVLREALTTSPTELPGVRNELAEVLLSMDRTEDALAVADEAIAKDADDQHARYLRGVALAALGDAEAARAALLPLTDSEQFGTEAAAVLGEVCRTAGWLDDAEAWFDRAVDATPSPSAWLLRSRGALRRTRGRLDEAEADLRASLEAEPGDAFAVAHLAGLLFDTGRMDEALEQFGKVTSPSAELRAVRGSALHAAGRVEEAVAELEDAVWMDPTAYALGCLGRALVAAGRPEEALSRLRDAVAAAGRAERGDAAAELALTLLDLGRVDEAWGAALDGVRSTGDQPQPWVAVAAVANRTAAPEIALTAAERGTRTRGQHPWAYRELGRAWERSGRADGPDRALDAYTQAVALDAGDLWSIKGRANALYLLGRLDEADATYREVVDRVRSGPPPDWRLRSLEGWCLLRTGQHLPAARALQSAVAESVHPATALFDVVLAALAAGSATQARQLMARGFGALDDEPPVLRRGTARIALGDVDASGPHLPHDVEDAVAEYRARLLDVATGVDDDPLRLPDEPWFTAALHAPDDAP